MSISVTRTTIVRVHHELDTTGCEQLQRILVDLIDHQGITELILDLSHAQHIDRGLEAVLAQTQTLIDDRNGTLELRTPPEPSTDLLDMVDEIPAFTPLEHTPKH